MSLRVKRYLITNIESGAGREEREREMHATSGRCGGGAERGNRG